MIKIAKAIICFYLSAVVFAVYTFPGVYSENDYFLFLPKHSMHKLIVVLHGSGERGGNYIDAWKKEAEEGGYLVLAPNSINKAGWSGEDALKVLNLVKKIQRDYEIKDTLLNGSSSGGHFALYLGVNNYQMFNGVATFMGLISNDMDKSIRYMKDINKQIPILLVHGLLDDKIPIQYARWNYRNIQAKGYPVTYWEEPDMKHEHYMKVNKDILNWFESIL
ncbi:MAG: hypothetical protein A2Y40_09075 [Candidatus Margulisbacteria bacterium GWF2_35_9]|nr:MAG: hypothetical protein A2Y40_09075 [Candidatus Margulisbacteria bacterium GWF2_35_9]